jgi:recombination protein RecA
MGLPSATKVPTPVKPKELELVGNEGRLKAALEHVNKTVEGANLMRFNGEIVPVPVISSGSLAVDCALGIGGYAQGRVVEVYGPESSGKTTLTLHAIAEAQKAGGLAAFIDAEHALDLKYASNLNVNVNELLLSQPDNGEQALDIMRSLLAHFKWGDIIVVDSVAALVTKAEIEGDVGSAHIGQTARLMSQTLKMIVGELAKCGALLFFTNQLRDAVNMSGYGPTTSTTGGNALKFYASQRINTKRIGSIDGKAGADGKAVRVANQTEVHIVKNKMAPPFATALVTIRFGLGISRLDEIIEMGKKHGCVLAKGSYLKCANPDKPRPEDPKELEAWWLNMGQGLNQALDFLKARPEVATYLEHDLRAGLGFA